MYDDDVNSGLYSRSFYHPAPFPTKNIATPIVLLYGTRDSLVDIDLMLSQLPEHTVAEPIEDHEHVDILWGSNVHKLVIPKVLEALGTPERADTDRMLDIDEERRTITTTGVHSETCSDLERLSCGCETRG
jgi:hypothetical protein